MNEFEETFRFSVQYELCWLYSHVAARTPSHRQLPGAKLSIRRGYEDEEKTR